MTEVYDRQLQCVKYNVDDFYDYDESQKTFSLTKAVNSLISLASIHNSLL